MTKQELLKEIRARLERVHGSRLRGVILYGSEARGDARTDSDIDVLVLLDEPINYAQDLETNIKVLYPLALELDRRISPKPVSPKDYEQFDCPLFRAAHKEGILA